MKKAIVLLLALVALGAGAWLYLPYHESTGLSEDTPFVVADGATLTSIAREMQNDGIIDDDTDREDKTE